MFHIQLGQPKVGKTTVAKNIIQKTSEKKVIFDFNNDFHDIDGVKVNFEDYHPLVDALNLQEVKVLNAAYLKTSRCLMSKAEDIYRETNEMYKHNIVQEAIERLHASWVDYEMDYAKELSQRIPLKVGPKQKSINDIVSIIENNEITIIKSKNIHSDHLRAMMYMVLHKISKNESLKVKIIADEVATLFFKGNLKLLFDVVDVSKLDVLLSCNRPSVIPKIMTKHTQKWSLFKNTDKSEIKWMNAELNIGLDIDVEKIRLYEYKTQKQLEEVK